MESSLLAALFASSISINLIAVLLVYSTGRRSVEYQPFYSVIALCIANAAFQFCNWRYHAAVDLESAVFWSKGQITSAALLLPPYFHTFSVWSRRPKLVTWLKITTTIAVFLIVVNWMMPYGVRFSEVNGLKPVTLYNGEIIHVISGEASPANLVYLGFIAVVIALVMLRLKHMLDLGLTGVAISLIVFAILHLIAVMYGGLIDRGMINGFYIAGFNTTLLIILICLNIANQVKMQASKLTYQVGKRRKVEDAISALATDVSSVEDKSFYEHIVLNLQSLFGTKMVFVGLYHDDKEKGWIETLACANKQAIQPNFEYQLRDSPCEEVVGKSACVHPAQVAQKFPRDKALQDKGIEAYVGMPMFDADNKPLGLIALLHDTSYDATEDMLQTLKVFAARASAELARNKVEKQLRHMAYFDYTTGLANRATLFDAINKQFRANTLKQEQSVLLLFDLDHFKDVNRHYGYDIAEDVLKEVGNRLNHYASDNIFVARNDGDEFAVLIKSVDTEPVGLINVQWEALQAIIRTPIYISGRSVQLECSMGAVVFPGQTGSRFDVLRSAETALQQAKRTGRGRCEIFDPELQRTLDRRFELENALKQAIVEGDQLFLVYQPQTDAKGQLMGGEVLVRWQHPDLGFVSPMEFIPIAEDSGIIHALGDWIIDSVFSQMAQWQNSEHQMPGHISINVSAIQLSSPEFVESLLARVKEFDIPAGSLVLELTESGLLENMQLAVKKLRRLRQQGIRIALDDFGTGYSSLSYLKDLPLDIIKIDKSFVDELFDTGTQELIESIIAIGTHMHLEVIAEGTETAEQIQRLEKLGCQRFQGYHFSKPLPAIEFIEWKFDA